MSFSSVHRGHRYNVLLRDASTVYLDTVDLVTCYEGFSPGGKLHYEIGDNGTWSVIDRPDLTMVSAWREAQTRFNTLMVDRFTGQQKITYTQRLVFEEIARMVEAGEEVLAALVNNKTLAALRDRCELVIVHRGVVRLTSLGRHLVWLRDHPQPRRPAFGDPSIPPRSAT